MTLLDAQLRYDNQEPDDEHDLDDILDDQDFDEPCDSEECAFERAP